MATADGRRWCSFHDGHTFSSQRRWATTEPASYRLGISVNDISSWRPLRKLADAPIITAMDAHQLLLLYQYMVYYLIYADV